MRALVYDGPHHMHVADVPRPAPSPGEVLVEVKCVGICGSDVHGYSGASGRRTPGMVMGHEFAGVVRALGTDVVDVEPSMRVAVNPLLSCGACVCCRAGIEQLCRLRTTIGVNTGLNGAFAEYVVVPARNVVPLADTVSFAEGALAEPLAVGLHAVAVAEPVAGAPLLVIGGGTIGLCTLLAAQQRGVGSVFVVDMLRHKLDMAARLGAAPADARTTDVSMLAHEQIGGLGFTHIIDAVAVSSTIKQALPALAPGGTLTLVGLATPLVEMGLYDLVPQERIVNSAYAYTAGEYRHAVDLITTRTIDVRPLIEDVCSLEDAPDRFAQLAAGTSDAIKVVVEIMA